MAGKKHRVAVIGSGNWGTTVAKLVSENTRDHGELFEEEVQMWVYEESVKVLDSVPGSGEQELTSVINTRHENVKYLPGIRLPTNLVANPSLAEAVRGASILVFNFPHEFVGTICKQLKGKIQPYARGISCIKGVSVTDNKMDLICEHIGEELGIYVGALSGANIAVEVAREEWCETTIAYNMPPGDKHGCNGADGFDGTSEMRDSHGRVSRTKVTPVPEHYPTLDHSLIESLFSRPYFTVSMCSDVAGVSLGGALKNIVAIAAGYVEGYGWNVTAKTAVMRRGMLEMVRFGREFYPETIEDRTFWEESAGWGDMVVSCTVARNWKYSKMAAERRVPVQEIERTELNGQKLQGISTTREVNAFLKARVAQDRYPLFQAVEAILDGTVRVEDLPRLLRK